jgi:hypothetical protein
LRSDPENIIPFGWLFGFEVADTKSFVVNNLSITGYYAGAAGYPLTVGVFFYQVINQVQPRCIHACLIGWRFHQRILANRCFQQQQRQRNQKFLLHRLFFRE